MSNARFALLRRLELAGNTFYTTIQSTFRTVYFTDGWGGGVKKLKNNHTKKLICKFGRPALLYLDCWNWQEIDSTLKSNQLSRAEQ